MVVIYWCVIHLHGVCLHVSPLNQLLKLVQSMWSAGPCMGHTCLQTAALLHEDSHNTQHYYYMNVKRAVSWYDTTVYCLCIKPLFCTI